MSYYDPYTGHQIRALRSDPTSRIIELSEPYSGPWWKVYIIGILAGCVVCLLGWAAL